MSAPRRWSTNRRGRIDPRRRYIGDYLLSDWREQVEEKKDPEQGEMEQVLRRQFPQFIRDFRACAFWLERTWLWR